MQNLLKGMTGGKHGTASILFSVALKAGLLFFYVITKDRAATFSDIEIFLLQT
jgi:hypothetical protein